ncbi:ferredoxin-type protein NapF [Trabulsiella guamensis]|uniref:ferredoxin-type protein NapF n=1 Tax=Trabulsiella guamensis TaxID=158852 RepID=UPI0009077180|nr:ferredoxin-type protein NapF [Trabulsiella guamensis]
MVDVTRRGMLTGSWRNAVPAIRPPWSGGEADFLARCTRCDRCVEHCETGVLNRGSGGYPTIDFLRGECSFCYACAKACPESLFLPRHTRAWELTITIGERCLAQQSIDCRHCQDSCDASAIVFRPGMRGIWQPELNQQTCNGCGACVTRCPVNAITAEYSHGNALAGL